MIEKLLGLPINASAHGGEIDRLMLLIHILMAVMFVGWSIFYVFALARFRRSKHPKANYYGVQGNTTSYIELSVAIIELGLLFGFSVPFWYKKVAKFPPPDEALHVRVVAQQFAWNIHYPGPDGIFGRTDIRLVNEQTNPIGLDRSDPHAKDDIVELNQLRIPVNTNIIVHLSTKDVVHSFFLPLLRVKHDTVPGMTIPVYFKATMTTDEIRERLARTYRIPAGRPAADIARELDPYVAMQDYTDADGNLIVRKGRSIPAAAIEKLSEIRIGPRFPTEIACAQLCGNSHYRMRGTLSILTADAFQKWMQEALEELQE